MKKLKILLGSLLVFITLIATMLPSGHVYAAQTKNGLDLTAFRLNELASNQRAITITFDDGYENIYQNGYPILTQYGFKATVFMITGMTQLGNAPFMSIQELQTLYANGWEIDSHSVTHPYFTQLTQSQLEAELTNSKNWIINNGLGNPLAFAYPYGDYNSSVAAIVGNYYKYARTADDGMNDFVADNVTLKAVILWGNTTNNSLSSVEQSITNAINQGKWEIIILHGVTTDQNDFRLNADYGWLTTDVLTNFVAFLKNANVQAKNFSEIRAQTNRVPVAVSDAYICASNSAFNISAPGILSNDTDADGDTLSAVKVTNPSHGTVTLNNNGSFIYTPATGYTGADSFTYKANDGSADSNTATVAINITNTVATFGLNGGNGNTPIEVPNKLDAMRLQNTAGSGTLNKLELLVDDLTASGKGRLGVYADNAGKPGALLLDAGEVNIGSGWISKANLSLQVSANTYYWLAFTMNDWNYIRIQSGQPGGSHYSVSRTYGTLPTTYLSGGVSDASQYVMRATISLGGSTPANNPPVAANDSYTTAEDTALTVAAPGVLSNDTDADSDTITAVKVTNPSHGTVTLNSNGSFTYTPAANYNGSDTFTYKANDTKADSNTATVSLTITAVNDAPAVTNDTYTTAKNTVLTVSAPGVLSNDTDVDSSSLTAIKVTDPSHGTVTLNTNGSFTYTPSANYTGTDSFTYKANDGSLDSNIATVTITISAVNAAPVAANDSYATAEDTAFTVAAPGVLSNDTDADSDTLTAIKVTNPSHGTVTLNSNGSFTYTPTSNYNGSDAFTYKANDTKADSNTATVTITITAVNDAPVASNDTYSTIKNTTLTVASPGVLANDSDLDGDSLTAVKASDPSHGAVTLNSNGSFTYVPTANYTGTDSFTYKANDGKDDSNTATVTITITDTVATFGLNSGNSNGNDDPNYLCVVRLQNTAGTGTLTKLEILVNDTTPNGKVRLGVYADSNGAPGALLLEAEVTVANGWVGISGLSLAVVKGIYYWLAYDLQSANTMRYQSGQAANSNRWIARTYGAFPAQYPSGSGSDSTQTVMRATVSMGG